MSKLPDLQEGVHYRVDATTGCWIWLGRSDAAGYALHAGNKAGRMAWEAAHGAIPPGQLLRHRVCSNRACVRLDHLAIGSHADNSDDMRRANRGSRAMAVLQAADIAAIVRRLDAGETGKAIASDYGVATATINNIRIGATWRHEVEAARGAGPELGAGEGDGVPAAGVSALPELDRLPSSGALVRQRREQLGLTQKALGQQLDCAANFISMVEDERSRLPLSSVRKWARVLVLPELVVLALAMVGRRKGFPEMLDLLFGSDGYLCVQLADGVGETLDWLGDGGLRAV